MIGLSILGGITLGIFIDLYLSPVVEIAQAETVATTTPEEIKVLLVLDYSNPKDIEKLIRQTFPEAPETAVRVAKCESGLKPHAKGPTSDFGIFQIHKPSWDARANKLGFGEYETDVEQNVKMARYIYDGAGKRFTDWVCYTRKMY